MGLIRDALDRFLKSRNINGKIISVFRSVLDGDFLKKEEKMDQKNSSKWFSFTKLVFIILAVGFVFALLSILSDKSEGVYIVKDKETKKWIALRMQTFIDDHLNELYKTVVDKDRLEIRINTGRGFEKVSIVLPKENETPKDGWTHYVFIRFFYDPLHRSPKSGIFMIKKETFGSNNTEELTCIRKFSPGTSGTVVRAFFKSVLNILEE